ncbi:MAG TPA: SIR2 family protein [Caulobacteraceae bacterium]|nr:SIR2 family protein [Caulobacteraceae bacterium]
MSEHSMNIQDTMAKIERTREARDYTVTLADTSVIEFARSAFQFGSLTPFLGAGFSDALKFPKWNQLVDDLYSEVFGEIFENNPPDLVDKMRRIGYTNTALVRQIEVELGFQNDLTKILRAKLYNNYDEHCDDILIQPFCDMFISPPNGVNEIITYNFDNALERHLKSKGVDFSIAYSGQTYKSSGKLMIYHPHGFLPHPGDPPDDLPVETGVVFSERHYNRGAMDPNHWANVVQVHHLMNRMCLFIGMSITDPELRRFMDYAFEKGGRQLRHVTIQRKRGDRVESYLMEKDFRSLGLRTIWIDDHEDIPNILESITRI